MSEGKSWTFKGHYPLEAKNSSFGFVYAVVIASVTFQSHAHRYSPATAAIFLLAGAFIAKKAFAAASILGVTTAIFSLLWLLPLFNQNVFYTVDGWFMLAHSALALAVGLGAFSYLKN
jgi:hypothetical protein